VNELDRNPIGPITTNAQFIYRALRHPDFRAGHIDTGFVERHLDELTATRPLSDAGLDLAADYFVGLRFQFEGQYSPSDVWHAARGFRANGNLGDSILLCSDGEPADGHYNTTFYNGRTDGRHVYFDGTTAWVTEDGRTHQVEAYNPRGTGTSHGVHDGEIEAPMPGRVTTVEISRGEKVAKGQRLLTLEAMKMEHALTAPFDGTVAELSAAAGQQVTEGQLLVRVEAEPSDA
jgi:3-methylcrotonyl-CoA carboxylase alpha subunit